jgi:hypothetical protein
MKQNNCTGLSIELLGLQKITEGSTERSIQNRPIFLRQSLPFTQQEDQRVCGLGVDVSLFRVNSQNGHSILL